MTRPLALIVEDDLQIGPIFSLALQKEFDTEIITDGQAALDRLARVAPAIVVLDVNLPKVSGSDILKYIRADARLAKTKVIIATGDSNQFSALSGEADIALLKPVSPFQLRKLALRLHSS
jgi:DNA-binding response OmpR family regulator